MHVTGAETIAGAKTFTGSVLVPTATASSADGTAASKAYVDGAIVAAVGGEWVTVAPEDMTSELFDELFELVHEDTQGYGAHNVYEALTDVQICFCFKAPESWFEHGGAAYGNATAYFQRGALVPEWASVSSVAGSYSQLLMSFMIDEAFDSAYGHEGYGVMTGDDEGTLRSAGVEVDLAYAETPFEVPEQLATDVAGSYVVRYKSKS